MSGGREEKTETQPACKICRNEEYMKKQNKGVPTNRDIRWDRLDNTASQLIKHVQHIRK